jgi:hypothetical protein
MSFKLTLLTSTKTDDLAVQGVANAVGLGVLERNGRHSQVTLSRLGQSAVALGDEDSVESVRRHNLGIVAVLLQGNTVDSPCLLSGRDVVVIHLEDEVLAALLLLEDVQSLGGVARRNDTVRNLTANYLGGRQVDLVGQSNHVTEAGHPVGTTSPGISLSQTRLLNTLDVVDHVDLPLLSRKGNANRSTCGRDVLEAGGSRVVERLAQLLDQRPCVQSVQQVDVSRRSTEDLERQRLVGHGDGRGLLVRVGAVAERQELLTIASILLPEELGDGAVVCGSLLEGLERVALPALSETSPLLFLSSVRRSW